MDLKDLIELCVYERGYDGPNISNNIIKFVRANDKARNSRPKVIRQVYPFVVKLGQSTTWTNYTCDLCSEGAPETHAGDPR